MRPNRARRVFFALLSLAVLTGTGIGWGIGTASGMWSSSPGVGHAAGLSVFVPAADVPAMGGRVK